MNSLFADSDLIHSDIFEYKAQTYIRFQYINNQIVWHKIYEDRKGLEYAVRDWSNDSELESQYKLKKNWKGY